jgi:hypothetical protein
MLYWQSSKTDQDQMDQNRIQCILNDICNDPVDLDPFLKIAAVLKIYAMIQKILKLVTIPGPVHILQNFPPPFPLKKKTTHF